MVLRSRVVQLFSGHGRVEGLGSWASDGDWVDDCNSVPKAWGLGLGLSTSVAVKRIVSKMSGARLKALDTTGAMIITV